MGSQRVRHNWATELNDAKLLQSYSTLCDPMNYSPPGSPVQGILQARILEWVAISSSRGSSHPGIEVHLLHLLHWQEGSLSLVHLGSPSALLRATNEFLWMPKWACGVSQVLKNWGDRLDLPAVTRHWKIISFWLAHENLVTYWGELWFLFLSSSAELTLIATNNWRD